MINVVLFVDVFIKIYVVVLLKMTAQRTLSLHS